MQPAINDLVFKFIFGVEERKEGIKEGIKEGTRERALLDAGNLKRLGVSLEIIAEATGLSTEELEKL